MYIVVIRIILWDHNTQHIVTLCFVQIDCFYYLKWKCGQYAIAATAAAAVIIQRKARGSKENKIFKPKRLTSGKKQTFNCH